MSETKHRLRAFLFDIVRGFAIGVAFIIPGFSGGSIAAILGIYEKLINAIADIFKDFKNSFLTLLPIALGMVIGVVSLLFPLGYALAHFPFPTVCLFVGLALGGLPAITENVKGKIKLTNVFAFLIPALATVLLCFSPIGEDVNLLNLSIGGCVILFLVGIMGSTALVIPGISGSMLLLIFGYYNPIVNMITHHFFEGKDVGVSLLVLGTTALGIGVGFIAISVIMKWLFKKCPRGTYFAIIGFIIGSIPTIYASVAKDAGYTWSTLPTSVWHWIVSALMLFLGAALSYMLVRYSRKQKR